MKGLKEAFDMVASKLPVTDPTVKARLDRGYGILISQGYSVEPQQADTTLYRVKKASTSLLEDSSASYLVDTLTGTCSCPDWPTARAGLCKHRISVMMLQEIEK